MEPASPLIRMPHAIFCLVVGAQNWVAKTRDERGAAMAEYGLLLALVALGAMGIMLAFGQTIADVFTGATETLEDNIPDASGTTPPTP